MSSMSSAPVAWTIAGSDSSAGAGIQADIKTMQSLSVYCASVVTSVTAQNTQAVTDTFNLPPNLVQAQLNALRTDLSPNAIKIGMIGSSQIAKTVLQSLASVEAPIVYDPVMVSTSGDALIEDDAIAIIRSNFLPRAKLLTPNWSEAHVLAERQIVTPAEGRESELDEYTESLAQAILARGAKSVLLKGGHLSGPFVQDFWTDGTSKAWFTSPRQIVKHTHGTGCTLSSAIAAELAKGNDVLDAIVVAKAFVNLGLRSAPNIGFGSGPLSHADALFKEQDLPWITQTASAGRMRTEFQRDVSVGFYPVVPDSGWVERVAAAGAKTIQLRIKCKSSAEVESEIANSIEIARRYGCNLYINDFWELAIKHNAYGVHLGQEDILDVDIASLSAAQIRLGISTHCYSEVARALAFQPSYIAIGPIFPTTTKTMKFDPQGIDGLANWAKLLSFPLVAIGGITLENANDVLRAGAKGIAVVRDVVNDVDPDSRVRQWNRFFNAAFHITK